MRKTSLSPKRLSLLQHADQLVTDFLREQNLYKRVWQCPVVLLPLTRTGGETIAVRPITSVDGMTAEVAQIPVARVAELARRLMLLDGVEAVLYDVSDKPPATIEWE